MYKTKMNLINNPSVEAIFSRCASTIIKNNSQRNPLTHEDLLYIENYIEDIAYVAIEVLTNIVRPSITRNHLYILFLDDRIVLAYRSDDGDPHTILELFLMADLSIMLWTSTLAGGWGTWESISIQKRMI